MASKIVHLTSVHQRFDTRIFLKECRSLSSAGYDVSLVVADGDGDALRDGVKIFCVGSSKGRFDRICHAPGRVYQKAISIDADLYHFHDPELIPIGLRLKRQGKKVIFDAHEDVPKQLLSKPYLNGPSRWVLSRAFAIFEQWACPRFDVVVTATPAIRDKYLHLGVDSLDINNFPLLGELSTHEIDWRQKRRQVCYVGGITHIRGIQKLVEALRFVSSGTRLQLGGQFSESVVESAVRTSPGWDRVDALGYLSRTEVADTLSRCVAGLVNFLPAPNHLDAQPNKMFEYMSAGVPVIASNFPLWREIIEGNQCGVCVDPLDPHAIAHAIDYLVTHPDVAEQMGRNGQDAVRQKYNWSIEEKKLLALYERLLGIHH